MVSEQTKSDLIQQAISVRGNAHAPYSGFSVGAAVLTDAGEIFVGCNVENASYGLSICAERAAICSAVSSGQKTIRAIAVAAGGLATPCGACRQFINEFGADTEVICVDADNQTNSNSWLISELLPHGFGAHNLN